VTPYSQTNTGFTPAPEENDRVALYFPSENESHGIVIGAVNNDGNGRFTNPDKRNFTLGPSQASKGGNSANEGKPKYNFTLDSEKFIVNVGSIISMTSSGTVDISGTSSVDMKSTNSEVNVSGNTKINMTVSSSKIDIEPSNININASDELKADADGITIGEGASTVDIKGGEVKIK